MDVKSSGISLAPVFSLHLHSSPLDSEGQLHINTFQTKLGSAVGVASEHREDSHLFTPTLSLILDIVPNPE